MKYVHAAVMTAMLVFGAGALAQDDSAQPPCSAPEYRQFDFWLGEWTVTEKDQPAGKNTITVILDGCVLLEEWAGAGGYAGKSFTRYDAATGKWQQTWVDSRGGALNLVGGMVDGKMVFEGNAVRYEKPVLDRITWMPNEDGSVRQHWEVSRGDGVTWSSLFDGLYKRAN